MRQLIAAAIAALFLTILRSPVKKAVDAPRFVAERKRPTRDVTAYVRVAPSSVAMYAVPH